MNIVMDAISLTLKDAFPESKVHDTPIPQDFETPAFFVRQIAGPRSPLVGYTHVGEKNIARSARHRRSPIYEITYFPTDGLEQDQAAECREVQEVLLDELELIVTQMGDLLSGRNIESKPVDNVLVMIVTYPHNVVHVEPTVPMEELSGAIFGQSIKSEEDNNA